ncbi:MAG: hypothetical protein R3C26_08270 [Calditrichia bacterium]
MLKNYSATTVQQQMVTGLKWPNDIWTVDKKICGILPESSFGAKAGVSIILLHWIKY